MKLLLFCLFCLANLASAAPTQTADVTIDRYTYPPIIIPAGGRDVHAGQYLGVMDRDPITAWCAELEQFLQFGTVQEYNILAAADVYGADTALSLAQLLSWTNHTGHPSDALESAALQVDIWRILAGADPIGDYTGTPITVRAAVLHHNTRQDLLIGQPLLAVQVDEPDPGIPLSLGIGFIAGYLATRRIPTEKAPE